jgi:hypothetical protein
VSPCSRMQMRLQSVDMPRRSRPSKEGSFLLKYYIPLSSPAHGEALAHHAEGYALEPSPQTGRPRSKQSLAIFNPA